MKRKDDRTETIVIGQIECLCFLNFGKALSMIEVLHPYQL